jgi:methylmalonyl-CoA mutase C-terminal domain/subunit
VPRKIRVLVGKPGLDGHDRGAKVVAAALRDAGMEVIYTGLHQSPAQVVEAALQEDVDVVALSILSGAHMTLFPEVLDLMKSQGLEDRLLTGGGIIPPDDMERLTKLGVGRLFGPGASTQEIIGYIRMWFVQVHGEESLAPPPQPAAANAGADRERKAVVSSPSGTHKPEKTGTKLRRRDSARASVRTPVGAGRKPGGTTRRRSGTPRSGRKAAALGRKR